MTKLLLRLFVKDSRNVDNPKTRTAIGRMSGIVGIVCNMLLAALKLAVGILSVMFPLLSRFETGFVQLLRNTVFLALANLPRTLCLAVVNTAAILLCIRLVAPLFILPALSTLITTLFLEPMFKPFMPKEEPEEQ